MLAAVNSHLRKVRDAQHLMIRRHFRQFGPHGLGRLAADVAVDLVKHQHRNAVMRRQYRLYRQHHARHLSTGGDQPQRLLLLARVRRKFKFHQVHAARTRIGPAKSHRESPVLQPQRLQFLFNGLAHFLGG